MSETRHPEPAPGRPEQTPALRPDRNMTDPLITSAYPVQRTVNAELIRAMCNVMKKVKEIAKTGYNRDAKYEFIYVGDVMAVLQDAMSEEGLVLAQREITRTVHAKIAMIKYEFDLYHTSGVALMGIASHTGACRFEFKSGTTDDKAINKCHTAAYKTVVLKLFQIPPDDNKAERREPVFEGDPDAYSDDRDPPDERAPWRGRRDGEPPRDDRPRDDRPRDERPRDERSLASPDGPPTDRWGPIDSYAERDGYGTRSEPREPVDGDQAFRQRVMAFSGAIKNAIDEDAAHDMWRSEHELLDQCTDTTYEYLRGQYQERWGIFPPTNS